MTCLMYCHTCPCCQSTAFRGSDRKKKILWSQQCSRKWECHLYPGVQTIHTTEHAPPQTTTHKNHSRITNPLRHIHFHTLLLPHRQGLTRHVWPVGKWDSDCHRLLAERTRFKPTLLNSGLHWAPDM